LGGAKATYQVFLETMAKRKKGKEKDKFMNNEKKDGLARR
jgi:hypothetical protein